ncbi:CHAD domain-containing protein [Leptolyngbya iicbica]|nr:CHAD domain-containing protein [Leptolyngbya sp. LK]
MKTAIKSTVGVLATESLAACLQKAEKYEKPVANNTDPEDLHQMRVQLRRLRTAMQVFAPSLVLPKGAREAQVAQVARKLGKQRDLDVIGITLQTQFAPDLPDGERAMLDKVRRRLAKRQQKAHRRVKKELQSKRYKTLKSALYKWTAAPDCKATARLSIDAVLPDLMLPLVSQLWLHPGWLLGTKVTRGTFKPDTRLSVESVDALMSDRSSTLHSLRKQVKRVRYQLKFVSEHYGDRLTADLERFADLQDVLGALQDSLVLEDFLAEWRSDWAAQLPTLKSLLLDSRHRAWQQWQAHQAYYLTTKNRHALRQILLVPGAAAPKAKAKATSTKSTKAATAAPAQRSAQASKTRQSRSKNTTSRQSSPSPQSSQPDNNGAASNDN